MGDVAISGRLAGTTLNNGIETLQRAVVGSDGSQWTLEQGVIGGERNTSSLTNNYDAVKHECNSNMLANSASAQNVGTGGTTPIFLMGITIRATTTGTVTIAGLTDVTGAAVNWVIPATTVTSGVPVQVLPPGNARRMENGCTMTCSVGADGPNVLVDWRPI
jgi:hypothetical protein